MFLNGRMGGYVNLRFWSILLQIQYATKQQWTGLPALDCVKPTILITGCIMLSCRNLGGCVATQLPHDPIRIPRQAQVYKKGTAEPQKRLLVAATPSLGV